MATLERNRLHDADDDHDRLFEPDPASPAPSEELHEERVKVVMEHDSPEGRPAEPDRGLPTAVPIFAVGAVLLIVVAGVVGGLVNPQAGVVLGVIAIAVLLIANPVTWALIMRMRDRGSAERKASPPAL